MKTINLLKKSYSKEELNTLQQIEAWEKVEKIAINARRGDYEILARDQYHAWCMHFFELSNT